MKKSNKKVRKSTLEKTVTWFCFIYFELQAQATKFVLISSLYSMKEIKKGQDFLLQLHNKPHENKFWVRVHFWIFTLALCWSAWGLKAKLPDG